MKEKIEEILEAYTNYGFGENLDNVIEMEFKMNTPTGKVGKYIGYPSLVKELSTLIQEERKEAVKNTILSIMSKVPTIMPHDKPDYILRSDFDRAIKEVESEGK